MIDLKRFWKEILNGLSIKLNALDYSTWIENLIPLCEKDGTFYVVAKTISAKEYVNKHLIDTINECLVEKFPFSIINKIEVIADVEKKAYISGENISTFETPEVEEIQSNLFPEYTFENFVIGNSNRIAYFAAQNVAMKPGKEQAYMSFNPLFLYGGIGLGKTHLLHAIGNYVKKNLSRLRVLYVAAETLSSDYMKASINQNRSDFENTFNINSFREKYINTDVLLLDDIQFLENKPGSQEVLFNIFNHLILGGSQLVIASDRPPSEIPTLEDRLISRLQSGLLIEIKKPSLETRINIVRKKMEQFELNLSDEIVYYIAENIDTNIRDLERNLKNIKLYIRMTNTITPSLSMVKDFVNKELREKEGVDSNDVLEAVSNFTGITIDKIIGQKRNKEYVEARDIFIYLMREYFNLPYVAIGQLLGGRDHSTITYSHDKTSEKIKTNKDFAKKIEDLKISLNL
ncbi:MAG TPA: chromosomal replication initiator protein DnaA [Clostridiales bacterium]|nr:chromosomal replication initiator protein DnaA [Clostridiales bacterium]